jgi:phosphatidylglycerophosphate synthase
MCDCLSIPARMIGCVLITSPTSDATLTALSAKVGGLALLKRQQRLLAAIGLDTVVIVCAKRDEAVVSRALAGRLAVAGTQVVVYPDDASAAEISEVVVSAAGGEAVLAIRAEWIVERGALNKLAGASPESDSWHYLQAGQQATAAVVAGSGQVTTAIEWLNACSPRKHPEPPTGALSVDVSAEQLRGVVYDESSGRAAEKALWSGCRKPTDGLASRYLNRPMSLFVSRLIASTPITPNQISIFNMLLGLAGAAMAACGTYWSVLLGALLLEAASVLDGCDGELARMRVQSSLLGEWLDTIGDDLTNQAFCGGLAYGAYQMTGQTFWLWFGIVAVVPMMATAATYYVWLYRHGRGDLLSFEWFQPKVLTAEEKAAQSLVARVTDVCSLLFRQDVFVTFFVVLALFGVLPYVLFVVAPAAVLTLGALWLGSTIRQG